MSDKKERIDKTMLRYLEHIGYKLIAKDFECDHGRFDYICLSPEDEICFFEKSVSKFGNNSFDFNNTDIDNDVRIKYERIAMSFLSNIDDDLLNRPVVFCHIELKIINDDRGLMRIHKLR